MNRMASLCIGAAVALTTLPRLAGAELMIVGNDQKVGDA